MKKIIPFILLIFALNSCGKAISKIAIDDRKEHIQTLQLNEGDKIKFWSKIKYKSESELDLQYSVQIFKNGELYTTYMYSPLKTNPRYLSSDERWIVSRKRNPDWIKPPGFVFNLLKFKWHLVAAQSARNTNKTRELCYNTYFFLYILRESL